MAFEFKFPDVGEGINEGEIVQVLVKEGDIVKEDDALAKIETDKAVVEVPSPKSGKILKVNVRHGETIKVGHVMFLIGIEGEKLAEEKKEPAKKEVPAKEIAAPQMDFAAEEEASRKKSTSIVGDIPDEEVEIQEPVASIHHAIVEKPKATLKVRRIAREKGIDLAKVKGSGPQGRILEKDLEQSPIKEEKASAPRIVRKYDFYGYVDRLPLKGGRKAIAEHMEEAREHVVPVSHFDEVIIDHLLEIKKKEQEGLSVKFTTLPFIVKAVIE